MPTGLIPRHERSAHADDHADDPFGDYPGDRPDNGLCCELLDGVLALRPGPDVAHQRTLLAYLRLLQDACPAELEVLPGPLRWRAGAGRSLRPDIVVSPPVAGLRLVVAPVLIVEVASAETQTLDHIVKRELYRGAGVPSYWVVDVADGAFLAYDLVHDAYRIAGGAGGNRSVRLRRPFPVTVCPADLGRRS